MRLHDVKILCLLATALALLPIPAAARDEPFRPADEKPIREHQRNLAQFATRLAEYRMTANQYHYDATYYSIALTINDQTQSIIGRVDIVGRALDQPLESIDLDFFSQLAIDSILAAGAPAACSRSGDLLTVDYPALEAEEPFALSVFYHGRPGASGFGAFTFVQGREAYVISTLSEPFFARHWWPCKDHPSDKADSMDMRVTIDSKYTVVSNGLLRSIEDNGDGTSTTHWHESYPITTYLVSLAISEYAHYADTLHYNGKTMPVEFYIFPADLEFVRDDNDFVVPMLRFFSDLYGEYPFIDEKYGHAQFFWGGAMEHQTCTSIGSFGEAIVAHELAHQWWGDMITCGTWHDIWLNEGFARYSEALWNEHVRGPEGLKEYMAYLGNLEMQVYVEDTLYTQNIFDLVVYDKGAFTLHTLRYLTGDSTFFKILRTYGESKHKHSHATTEDFRIIAEAVSGLDLRRFFDQWVYQPNIPVFDFGYSTYPTDSGWVTLLELRQSQSEPIFATDLDVAFPCGDTTITARINTDQKRQFYRFLLPSRPTDCRLDPDNWLNNHARKIDLSLAAIDDSLPDAFAGEPYRYQLDAVGGLPPISWSAFVVTLPEGLRISADGLLSGIPEASGTYEIAVHLADSDAPPANGTTVLPLRVNQVHGNFDDYAPVKLNDLLLLIKYLYRDGPPPLDPEIADANCDGRIDAVDMVLILNYFFRTGPRPCYSSPQ